MEVITNKLFSWAPDLEGEARDQALRTSRLPIVEGHVALMPDAHFGMGATIGSVIPTAGAIIPAAVGVDIGCGMIAVETSITSDGLPDSLDKLHGRIASVVPAGVGRGHENRRQSGMPKGTVDYLALLSQKQSTTAIKQFGSLGSGNHFVEVCLDERDRVWVVLHSGSRGVGNQLAQHHIKVARGMMKKYFITLEDPDLAYLVQHTPEFDAYIRDMLWAQQYAMGNRDKMMTEVLAQLAGALPIKGDERPLDSFEVRRINCHHNFTQLEHHNKRGDVWITRKGAIKADVGDMGVIPGSMGTSSYIVSGLGNPASYNSCSHGAGRRMSRRKARDTFTEADLAERMTGKAWNADAAKTLLDEHPDSYKDIDTVMAAQTDLVKIEHTLHQVLNYKGT